MARRDFLKVAAGVAAVVGTGIAVPMPAAAGLEEAQRLRYLTFRMASEARMPQSLVLAVAHVESGFRNDWQGPAGGRGLMQVLPHQAAGLGVHPDDLWFERPNLTAGMALLQGYLRRHGGDWRAAIRAYGQGPLDDHVPIPRIEGSLGRYARAVLKAERQYAEQITLRAFARRERVVRRLRAGSARP